MVRVLHSGACDKGHGQTRTDQALQLLDLPAPSVTFTIRLPRTLDDVEDEVNNPCAVI